MKTLKKIILGIVIITAFGAANAKSIKTANEKITINHAVSVFVNAIAHGKTAGLNEIMDNNFKFTVPRGKDMLCYNKTELLEFLKANENIEQDCKTTVSTNESNADITVVNVSMNYGSFTRVNYVTLANTVEGWKITNLYSVFK